MVDKIILASPRGFCAGVDRAIDIVEKALEINGAPIYVRHEIVHNQFVVKELEDKGVIFIEELKDVPDNNLVIFSAHGIPPVVREEAKARGLKTIDATCPLVTKVHFEALRYAKENCSIVLIGHKGHQEVIGTMGVTPMTLIETVEDVENLKIENPEKVAVLTQTTLSMDDTSDIVEALKQKFPDVKSLPKQDICYATQNRQNAVKEMAKQAELILVVGSTNSSNSVRLVETAKKSGAQSYLIPDPDTFDAHWFANIATVGVTSGASVPDELVFRLIGNIEKKLNKKIAVEKLEIVKENVDFGLPEEVKLKV